MKDRRKDDGFKREMIEFMARMDQRNMDRDLAHAVQDDLCSDHEDRIKSLEESRTLIKGASMLTPAVGGLAWFLIKFGHLFKEVK